MYCSQASGSLGWSNEHLPSRSDTRNRSSLPSSNATNADGDARYLGHGGRAQASETRFPCQTYRWRRLSDFNKRKMVLQPRTSWRRRTLPQRNKMMVCFTYSSRSPA